MSINGLLLGLLFYPYIRVQAMYGFIRTWSEFRPLLPRPQSYLLADVSTVLPWSKSSAFPSVPFRHEHQMFMGLIPVTLAIVGAIRRRSDEARRTRLLMVIMILLPVVLTLSIAGRSAWVLFHWLPLASAVKAMTRLDQALLFPIAYLAGLAVHTVSSGKRRTFAALSLVVTSLLVAEVSLVDMPTSTKEEWRQRASLLAEKLPTDLQDDRILLIAQRAGPDYADELDVMWFALSNGIPTMNGYSGNFPPGYSLSFGNDCYIVPFRVMSYLEFEGRADDLDAYRSLMARIEPVGFEDCDPQWCDTPPEL